MANTKISALTAATTPVAGTEVLPIVQSSTTKKVSIANLTAGRSVSAADYVMSTGNLVPSTAAKGINFTANTPASGMTSQLLNWYEEGTWTPTDVSGASLVFSNTSGNCYYTRVGNLVTCVFNIDYPITVSAVPMGITGLPFTAQATTNSVAGGVFTYQNTGVPLMLIIGTSSTSFFAYIVSSVSVIANSALSGKILRGVITYRV